MSHPLRHPVAAPPALAPVGCPAFIVPNLPCGCENGWVWAIDRSRATYYSDGPDIQIACPDCSGYGYHELRGTPNGPRWAELYPEHAGLGGWWVARTTDCEATIGWARSEEAARLWRCDDEWDAGPSDGPLLAALGVRL